MDKANVEARIAELPIWQGTLELTPLSGGRTNLNYLVCDDVRRLVVRIGADIPEHHVMRFNELAASHGAHRAGISPAVVYAEEGLSCLEYIESTTLDEAAVRERDMLGRCVDLMKRCHVDVARHVRGPILMFWVFHVIRDYGHVLIERESPYATMVPEFLQIAARLEAASGPFEIVFSHNDLMAANYLDDGNRLWLIDWDYAGFNTPLFDLGGLASNNQLNEAQEFLMLERYFEGPVDNDLWKRYRAMKTAALMREVMWSMVSELTSQLDVDYVGYTQENLDRFWKSYGEISL